MFEENFVPLSPINFFQLRVDCQALKTTLSAKNYQSYLLPDTSSLTGDHHFADVAMGWSTDQIELFIRVKQKFQSVSYPEIGKGDSVELCFDTRDVKTSGFNTRFCHHFYFLPEAIEGHIAGEITRFRTEEIHELCSPKDLKVSSQMKSDGYTMHISIPQECLHGYDPLQFDRLGFTYRINRSSGGPQHFSVVSSEFQMEQQPSLWSSVNLIK